MVRILNKRRGEIDGVYVGRPTKWGNPFPVGPDCTQEQAVAKYREWVMKQDQAVLRVMMREMLRGKDLVCWCAPLPCHAQVIADIANEESEPWR